MPDLNHHNVLQQLLAQDAPVSPEKHQEYRMHIEMTLVNAASLERQGRWTMAALWIASLLSLPFAAMLSYFWPRGAPFLFFLAIAFWAAAIVSTLFYFVRYRPALARASDERQTEILRELSRQVSELSRRLDAQQ